MSSRTAIVILNWNTRNYLEKFIPPLLESVEGLDAFVAVADSGSTDGSIELLTESFPSVVRIPLGENFGFTGGYNRALSEVEADYFILLNSDVEVPRGWLQPLVEWMDSHPDCGVCGPKLLSFNERSRFEYAGAAGGMLDFFGYPYCRGRVLSRTETDSGQYDTPAGVMWVSGAAMMVRSSLWKALGGLDERFFAHMEEIDFCWRAQLAGWSIDLVPASSVYHIGGGTLPSSSPDKLFFNYRNNLLLLENNLAATLHSAFRARVRILFRMFLDLAAALIYLLTLRPSSSKAVLRAHKDYRHLRKYKAHLPQSPDTTEAAEDRGWGASTPYKAPRPLSSVAALATHTTGTVKVKGFGGLLIFKYICSIF